jgi:hypothetical protein
LGVAILSIRGDQMIILNPASSLALLDYSDYKVAGDLVSSISLNPAVLS